jgi:hypothetical protein
VDAFQILVLILGEVRTGGGHRACLSRSPHPPTFPRGFGPTLARGCTWAQVDPAEVRLGDGSILVLGRTQLSDLRKEGCEQGRA